MWVCLSTYLRHVARRFCQVGAAADASAASSARIAVLVEKQGDSFVVKDVWMKVDARAFPAELLASL